jgi:hypothetical protein
MQAIAIESFQSLSARLIGLGLLHGLWISLGVASAVALGFQLRPYLSHQARHRVLVIALLCFSVRQCIGFLGHCAVSASSAPTRSRSD